MLVLDDEDSNNITVGSLVTVLVTLTRQTMAVSIKITCSIRLTCSYVLINKYFFFIGELIHCFANVTVKLQFESEDLCS